VTHPNPTLTLTHGADLERVVEGGAQLRSGEPVAGVEHSSVWVATRGDWQPACVRTAAGGVPVTIRWRRCSESSRAPHAHSRQRSGFGRRMLGVGLSPARLNHRHAAQGNTCTHDQVRLSARRLPSGAWASSVQTGSSLFIQGLHGPPCAGGDVVRGDKARLATAAQASLLARCGASVPQCHRYAGSAWSRIDRALRVRVYGVGWACCTHPIHGPRPLERLGLMEAVTTPVHG
jgi:hypothetical protein